MSYLIDTNVISELVKSNSNKNVLDWFTKVPNDSLYLSVLTIGEIRKGVDKLTDSSRKEKLRVWLEFDLPQWFGNRILQIDNGVAECWGKLQAQNSSVMSPIDSLIAATALHFNLRLVTRNISDFNSSFIEVINPWN